MKKTNGTATFADTLEDFKTSTEKKRLRKEKAAEQDRQRWTEKQTEANRAISALLAKANRVISAMLSGKKSDPEFAAYVIGLFNKHGHSFNDSLGVCGFPPPKAKWVKDPTAGKSFGIPGMTGKRLVGRLEDYKVPVCVLVLHEQKDESTDESFSMERPIGQHRDVSSPVIALTARNKSFLFALDEKATKDCRVVALEETVTEGLGMRTYDALRTFPDEDRFMDSLRALTDRKKAQQFFLDKFGAP
jgi:hypothetical protein